MSIRLHYIQHVAFEGPAFILEWAQKNGITVTATKQFQGDSLPEHDDYDMLLVMGGPMGVYDSDEYPWLADEKAFIAKAAELNKIVVGICLGAQLISHILGAEVVPNEHKEIGWFNVDAVDVNGAFPFLGKEFPNGLTVFHWHGDRFGIPDGAVRFLESEACANQGYVIDGRILGLQCHFEMQESGIEALIENCGQELNADTYVQTADQIRAGYKYIPAMNAIAEAMFDQLIART